VLITHSEAHRFFILSSCLVRIFTNHLALCLVLNRNKLPPCQNALLTHIFLEGKLSPFFAFLVPFHSQFLMIKICLFVFKGEEGSSQCRKTILRLIDP